LLKFILLGIFLFLLWRVVKPYVVPALQGKPEPQPPRVPPKKGKAAAQRVDGKLPHEILGVKQDAALSEIQEAYRKLVREYHPDKAAQLAPELRALALERTKQINRAYEVLAKERV
jgi:hypothetical protein